MRLIKKVRIEMFSEISNLTESLLPDGEPEISRAAACGELIVSDGATLIRCPVAADGGEILYEIEIKEGSARVKESGAVSADFLLREGAWHDSVYEVGGYKFDMSVRLRKMRNGITDGGGRLDLFYDMTVGGAGKSVRMKIKAE